LGNSTFISIGAYTQPKDPTCVDNATFERTFTSHSGDTIRFKVSGETCPTGELQFFLFTGTYIIEGGMGRYAGATGTGSVQTLIDTFTKSFHGIMKGNLVLQDGKPSSGDQTPATSSYLAVLGVLGVAAGAIVVYLKIVPFFRSMDALVPFPQRVKYSTRILGLRVGRK
jgi:hypothetical protein